MSKKEEVFKDGKRPDGRANDELRPMKMKVGILSNADGSSYLEWGGNKVICGVYGPREAIPKHSQDPKKSLVKVKYSMSTFASKEEHGRAGPSRRSNEISKVIKEALENMVFTEKYPRTQIDVFVDVLQAEGGTRVASITAAALALADAGIPMKDMCCGVAVGKAGDQIIVDLGKEEDNLGQSDMPLALSNRDKNILLLQMDGLLTLEEIEKAIELAEKASDKIHEMQKKAINSVYTEEPEEVFTM
ncbi:exosome complex exonuclease Rrp41 [Candidatus Micrarchaeota archaeon]|nr:exosome complex exonuclease Rrp41 [Candidatus Micrarchaeota archaeon]